MVTLKACPDDLTGFLNRLLQYEVEVKSAKWPIRLVMSQFLLHQATRSISSVA